MPPPPSSPTARPDSAPPPGTWQTHVCTIASFFVSSSHSFLCLILLFGCKVSGGRAGLVLSRFSDTLAPLALRPAISNGLLIIISSRAVIACFPAHFRPLALRPLVSSGLPFIISGQAGLAPLLFSVLASSQNALAPVALRPAVSSGLPLLHRLPTPCRPRCP